jgi:hypothetical protein
MDFHQHNTIANFIWNIADDVLRDVYVRGKYRDVILPMTVIRQLDAVLEPNKPAVLAMKDCLDKAEAFVSGIVAHRLRGVFNGRSRVVPPGPISARPAGLATAHFAHWSSQCGARPVRRVACRDS